MAATPVFDAAAYLRERGINLNADAIERRLIAEILYSDSFPDALNHFLQHSILLAPWRITLADERGSQAGFATNRTFSHGAKIVGLFGDSRVRFLDYYTLREQIRHGQANIPFGYSIGLDSQAMSYLVPHILGERQSSRVPKDLEEVIAFIAREDVNVDPLPYMIENMPRIGDTSHSAAVEKNLVAYEHLRTMDYEFYRRTGTIRTRLSAAQFDDSCKAHFIAWSKDARREELSKEVVERQQLMLCILLKSVSIQFDRPNKSLKKKLLELMQFMHDSLGTFFERELIVASRYFQQQQKLPFFSKIMRKRKHIEVFAEIERMAWDCWHARHLEEAAATLPEQGARYFLTALLTFDKRFSNLIEASPINGYAVRQGSSAPMLRLSGLTFGPNTESFEQEFKDRFFTDAALAERRSLIKRDVRLKLPQIIDELKTAVRHHLL
jgi:hypothetical protein